MWSLVTGAGTGIGKAVAQRLASRRVGSNLLLVGRREAKLEEARDEILRCSAGDAPQIKVVPADISVEEGRRLISEALCAETNGEAISLNYLIHNAGVIEPIAPLGSLHLDHFRKAMSVNVEGPLFLTQQLLQKNQLADLSRVLFVGSGAAHNAYHSWGSYCISKAAFHMTWKMMKKELGDPKRDGPRVFFGSVRPGVVDTPMQETIRTTDFENVDAFRSMKEEGKLVSAEHVGAFMEFLLRETEPEEFQAEEWDVRDESHHSRWLPSRS
mmetsp:Transcript_18887/g.26299  ORF Transcript_18887/g.26299 Transcript_18887/m.26299 type:complete len:270 (+) Transcript_18887:44-853(+)|eukprot:CAMPEP_0184495448 /NCGR_PEP_ID=MMETSP0113_2-20130426/31346_1 /TAXON_ID=91329 /ORGANISM="Norrisiella sphaerica, Strain BC52" /LENGTH=269 /DNA_ID=CAMNT_0026881635 /DNA_START=117 /DNA_END=926 /DNA_ORIENTATION=-